MSNHKFSVNLSFDIACDKDVEQVTSELQEILKNYAENKYLFVNQVSVQQLKDPYSGDALKVNDDGSPYIEKFEIKNVFTGIL